MDDDVRVYRFFTFDTPHWIDTVAGSGTWIFYFTIKGSSDVLDWIDNLTSGIFEN